MANEVCELAEYVAARLTDSFANSAYTPIINTEYSVEDDAGTLDEMTVEVFPWVYTDISPEYPSNRSEETLDVQINIILKDRYRSVGNPTRAWVKEHIRIVRDYIYEIVRQRGRDNSLGTLHLNDYWVTKAIVNPVYDLDLLRNHNLFWSEVAVTFRKLLI